MNWFKSKKKEAKKLARELSQLDEAKEYLETELQRIEECSDSWYAETLVDRYDGSRCLYLGQNQYRYDALYQLYIAARHKYLSLLDQEQRVEQLKSSALLRAKFRKPSIQIL
jgi:hypothetical protein